MQVAVTKKEIELVLATRFGDVFERHERISRDALPTGISDIDNVLGGLPRGGVTEIQGSASSGRTTLLLSALSAATSQGEICGLIDFNDTFDLSAAATAGIDFKRLLWVRCRNNLECAFKAADLMLHAGGFGFVALNLCDVPVKTVRRIMSSWWFRFRHTIEDTPTALLVLTPVAAVRTCASLALELKCEGAVWRSTSSFVAKNPNGVIAYTNQRRHLSIVRVATASIGCPSETHAHFLQAMHVRLDRKRPVRGHPGVIKFHPHHASPCCNIR